MVSGEAGDFRLLPQSLTVYVGWMCTRPFYVIMVREGGGPIQNRRIDMGPVTSRNLR